MLTAIISYVAAAGAFGIAVVVALRNYRSFTHMVLSVGMALLALEALISGVAATSPLGDAFSWQLDRLLPLSLLPGAWLAFSLVFGRNDHQKIVLQWKWPLLTATFVPPFLAVFFRDAIFDSWSDLGTSSMAVMRLGWSGYVLYLLCLVSFVLILMNLERVFRNATGHSRWQIKFMVLGLFVIFGVRIFTDSQAVLFRSVNVTLDSLNPAALLLACILIGRSLARSNPLEFDLYLSHTAIYNSFTVLIVGVYFIVVGLAAKAAFVLYGSGGLPAVGFVVLAAILGLALFLMSDRLRFKRKQFVSHHFKRPVYDYQKVWAGFTENTASITGIADLCLAVTTLVSHTLDVLSVSLWLVDEKQERLELGSSTMLSRDQAKKTCMYGEAGKILVSLMSDRSVSVDLVDSSDDPVAQLGKVFGEDLEAAGVRYCVPLRAAGKLIGLITLGKRVMDQKMSFEDYELLRTLGDQSAAALLNLNLSERLRQAKELEAFQAMSAFFLHDLKNLASRLSLVSQNMPKHYGNEEFREDAMRTVSQSVDKIKSVCTRLSLLHETVEIDPHETSMQELMIPTIAGLHGVVESAVKTDFPNDLPLVLVDKDQMRKVIENLLINANDATDGNGIIKVAARSYDEWVELMVCDDGVGIPREFIEKNLFKPFQTTKKQGMGIGLFHCKTIVEAHRGRIEVESEEGKGSTFRVILPVKG